MRTILILAIGFLTNIELTDTVGLSTQKDVGIWLALSPKRWDYSDRIAPGFFTWILRMELSSLCVQGKHLLTDLSIVLATVDDITISWSNKRIDSLNTLIFDI